MLAAILGATGCAPSRKGTGVCGHGFLRTRANTWAAAGALRLDGWKAVNWKYASRSRTIRKHAEALAADLRELAAKRPGEPISFAWAA